MESCGLCECKDFDSMCKTRADAGLCESPLDTIKGVMRTYCKEACGLCGGEGLGGDDLDLLKP